MRSASPWLTVARALINDPDISRRHAALDVQGEGKYVLRDLNSTNGTYLNGQRLTQPWPLRKGDRLQVGNTVLEAK